MASEIDLTRRRGDTFADRFNVTKKGVAVDISAKTFCMSINTLKEPTETAAPSATEVAQISGVIIDGPNGVVDFAPTVADTLNMPPATYFYDIQMTEGTEKTTIVYGKYKIVQDICKE